MLNRRDLFKTIPAFFASLTLAQFPLFAETIPSTPPPAAPDQGVLGPFTLPPLPYAYDALEPFIDARTMQIHHDKHHAAYVKNANKALVGHPELQTKTPEELIRNLDALPESIRTALRNNAGGDVNHTWFWNWMKPSKSGPAAPTGALATAIDQTFGGLDKFKDQFSAAALKVFGSGWAWLSLTPQGALVIETTPNQDNPIMFGKNRPILGLDVWEHAYYLKHQNVRADYIKDFFNVVNWEKCGQLFDSSKQTA